MLMAALGLSAIAARSAELFMLIRWAGAAYLIWMGLTVLYSSRRQHCSAQADANEVIEVTSCRRAFANGFLCNLLNPKAIIFFLSVLPQFIDPTVGAAQQILILGVLDVLIGVAWWWGVVILMARVAGALRKPRIRQWWDWVTGSLMIGADALLARNSPG